jgi:hypothetical protein
MNRPRHLSGSSKGFLFVVSLMADGAKIFLDLLFGIGIVLDPLVITPITTIIFWIVFMHNDMPMFSGRYGSAGWINLSVSLTPGIDAVPDWTIYTSYIIISDQVSSTLGSIMGG